MKAMQAKSWVPASIAEALSRTVVGQQQAVREMAIGLAKKISGARAGNILMIGSSGTGKTTLLRAVEAFLAGDAELEQRSTAIRVHANVLAEEAHEGHPGASVLGRLYRQVQQQLGEGASVDQLVERLRHGIVFVDEVDKIRAKVGDRPHVAGIRAQEALLTLIENEAVPFRLPDEDGGETVTVNSSGLLFVCAGAFEGLYDAVYDRVTIGADRGSLQSVTVVDAGKLREETPFNLRDWLRNEDLFDYGMSPQFLSRFDSTVLLDDLEVEHLVKILLGSSDSPLLQAKDYFRRFGVDLVLSPAAARAIAEHAARQPRLGARALKEVFRRVIREYEFEPLDSAQDGALLIDQPEVEAALELGA